MPNNSPWIHQLNHERATKKLDQDLKTDIAIVGAGIAGISTAFFLLKHTKLNVLVLEGFKLAHGATGHNAGQITSYFERPFQEIVEIFGLELACDGQKNIELAWELLDEMYTEAGLNIPLSRFIGYAGLATREQVLRALEVAHLRRKGGLGYAPIEVLESADFLAEIPSKYHGLFTLISREDISLKLETFDTQYSAVLSSHKGVMNSALFCQEVLNYLLQTYPERFSLYEHTPVIKVVLREDSAILDALNHTVECEQVVLCTNGFENFEILAPSGLSIDTRFHHALHGVVGFMTGYLDKHRESPAALSYYLKSNTKDITDTPGEPYFYVTRRSYEYEKEGSPRGKHSLVSVGGPDFALEDRAKYDRGLEFSESAKKLITDFIKKTYDKQDDLEYAFMWHGVMGYTKNMIRMIGPDPLNPHLFYNLGCNGVGILPSIFGGNKVARMIAGEKFSPSIFDIPRREVDGGPIFIQDLPSKSEPTLL